MLITGIK